MTAEAIEALDFTGKRKAFPVEGCRWLYLVVNGKPGAPVRSWVFRYRYKRTEVSLTLGRYPEVAIKKAKATADKLREEVLAGGNPKATPPPPPPAVASPTFKEMAEDFYARWVLPENRVKTQQFRRWVLDKYVLPALQDYKVSELTSFTVIKFLDTLGHRPVLQNRVKGILSKMFNWASLRYPTLAGNLTKGYERKKEKPRERRLTEDEIRALAVSTVMSAPWWSCG